MQTPANNRDTSPEAEAVLIRLLREKPCHLRLQEAVAASNLVAEQCKNAIVAQPGTFRDEVKLRFIAINYGQELADKVRDYVCEKR